MRRSRLGGFTLLELMITVAVLGLLAAIAYPSYTAYLDRGKRAQGKQALMRAAQRMERFYSDNNCYPSSATNCGAATTSAAALDAAGIPAASGDSNTAANSFYALSVTTTAQAYTLTATPANGFADNRCGNLTLDNTGLKQVTLSGASVDFCWSR